jgi:hypothetical protein
MDLAVDRPLGQPQASAGASAGGARPGALQVEPASVGSRRTASAASGGSLRRWNLSARVGYRPEPSQQLGTAERSASKLRPAARLRLSSVRLATKARRGGTAAASSIAAEPSQDVAARQDQTPVKVGRAGRALPLRPCPAQARGLRPAIPAPPAPAQTPTSRRAEPLTPVATPGASTRAGSTPRTPAEARDMVEAVENMAHQGECASPGARAPIGAGLVLPATPRTGWHKPCGQVGWR